MGNSVLIHRTRPAMGTLFEVLLRGDDEEHLAAVAEAALDEVKRIDRLLSRFDPRSEISRINRLAHAETVRVDYELAALLSTCFEANRWTHGAFDIAAPSRALTRATALNPIEFDSNSRTIRFTTAEIQLDLGGIGKGYALDRAVQILADHGIHHALLHGGTSSALACGEAENGAWRIDLRHPASGAPIQRIELSNAALSCSAASDQQGIIDPRTGQPVALGSACAIVAPTATQAEILSTACVCLGRDKSNRLIEHLSPSKVQCIWIE